MKRLKNAIAVLFMGLLSAPLVYAAAQGLNSVQQTPQPEPFSTVSYTPTMSELFAELYSRQEQSGDVSKNADSITDSEGDFQVLLTGEGRIVSLSPAEYLRGAVAAEMPLEYEDEALKAQIVAAHTYAVSYKLREKASPSPGLMGADISDEPSVGQAYIDDNGIRELYGDDTQELIERLDSLIEEVGDYIMLYEGEPVVAAYHAVSCGKTESARNIWGAYSPYLVAVDSSDDEESPDFLSRVMLTEQQVSEILESEGINLTRLPSEWLSETLITPSGYVSAANICGVSVSGSRLRELFGLRSACFDVSFRNGIFTFTVKGWGHGVGMSQYGAEMMAKSGSGFHEILKAYYTGVTFCEL